MKAQMLPASRCVLQIQQAAASVQQHSNAVVDGIAGGALRVQDDDKAGNCERLFKGLVFFLGREVPRELREQVLFVIRAYGGVVAWQGEGSPMDESDERITHQPLWVFDSANFGVVAKAELYGVGMVPPPHLSLFVQIAEEGNVPDYSQTMLKLQVKYSQEQARAACKRAACKRAAAAGTMDEYTFIAEDSTAADQIGSAPAMQDVSDEQLYEHELAQQMQVLVAVSPLIKSQALALKTSATLFEQAGSEDEEQTDAAEPTAQEAGAIAEVPDLDPEATVMMTRKQRGLYNAMQRGLSKKRQRVESLQAKAKKLKQPSS
ncbi:TPA: hypothetical protein ACH3X2_009696 [Trebouxia sp. C0005]